jgi:predicted dehydrogenase
MSGVTASLPEPRFPDPRQAPVLRWGVVGPGEIAGDFVAALNAHTDQRVVAVGSRSGERAAAFAARHDVERAYGSSEELVADPEVDVVYVAAPHTEHVRLALLAIDAGKHVLVEKPIAVTAAGARRILEAATAAGVFAMEAMWTRYLPHTDVSRQLLERGDLGEVGLVLADFCGGPVRGEGGRLLDPALGGGALLDLGVYVVSFASFALGRPERITVSGMLGPTGVDLQAGLVLDHPGGAQAVLAAGLLGASPWTASISGADARIEIAAPFWGPSDLRLVRGVEVLGEWRDTSGRVGRQGLCYQAAALARYVAEGRLESPLHPNAEAVAVLETLDEARHALGYADPHAWRDAAA